MTAGFVLICRMVLAGVESPTTGRISTTKGTKMKSYVQTCLCIGLLLASSGSHYVVADEDAPARMWEQAPLKGHRGGIVGLKFSSDGKTLISAGTTDGTFRLWDMASGKNTDTFHHMPKDAFQRLQGIALSPDGKTVASYADKTIRLWDLSNNKHIGTLNGGEEVSTVVFSADGKNLIVVEHTRTPVVIRSAAGPVGPIMEFTGQVRLWSVEKRQEISIHKLKSRPSAVMGYSSAKRPFLVVESSNVFPDRTRSYTLVDAITGKKVIKCEGPLRNRDYFFALDRQGTMLASAGNDSVVRIWDTKTGKSKATFDAPPASLGPLVFSPDGKFLACGYSRNPALDPTFYGHGFLVYEVSSGKVLADNETQFTGPSVLAFSPDGKLLAIGGVDSDIRLWTVPAAWRKKGK